VLECSPSWQYNEKWWQHYVKGQEADFLSIACDHSSAEFRIGYFIYDLGEMALTKIKTQNLYIKRLNTGSAKPSEIGPHDIDWQSGHTWLNLIQSWEELFDIYNANKAPTEIQSIIAEVKAFMDTGSSQCQALLSYIDEARQGETALREAEAVSSSARKKQIPNDQKWLEIEIANSKVTDGFIYILSNRLMPGIYKIGFTAGNPDRRAREISARHALPQAFQVVQYWRTLDPYIVEQRIHDALSKYSRTGAFFEIHLEAAKDAVQAHLVQPK